MVYTASILNNEHVIQYNRIGLIPYTINNDGSIHFLCGIDRKSREYTDFGGRINKEETENDALLREYIEESRMIIPINEITNVVQECTSIKTNTNKLYFVPVKQQWYFKDLIKFTNVANNRALSEIIGIKWIDEHDFARMVFTDISPQYLWNKIKTLVNTHYMWSDLKLDLSNSFYNLIKND